MTIVFLGTAGAGAPPGRAENSILVETKNARILLDCGPGCAQRLQEAGYSVRDVDAVYISHMHLDHWSGLFDLVVHSISEGVRPPRILVAEPLASHVYSVIAPLLPRSAAAQLEATPIPLGRRYSFIDAELEVVESRHAIECYGVLLASNGSRMVYTADTSPTSTYREIASRVDLLATEATMPTGMEAEAEATGHQTVSQALGYLDHMEPGSLLALIHLTRKSVNEAMRAGRKRAIVPNDLSTLAI